MVALPTATIKRFSGIANTQTPVNWLCVCMYGYVNNPLNVQPEQKSKDVFTSRHLHKYDRLTVHLHLSFDFVGDHSEYLQVNANTEHTLHVHTSLWSFALQHRDR